MSEIKVEPELIEFSGKSPRGVRDKLFRIPRHRIFQHFDDTGNRSKLNEAWLVPDICKLPAGIWKGLERNGQEEAFCYAGIPMGAFADEHKAKVYIPKGKVFMVFATPDLEVTKWRFCEADPDRIEFPIDHETRFGERLWPRD